MKRIELQKWLKQNGFKRQSKGSYRNSLSSDYTHFVKNGNIYRFRNNEYSLALEWNNNAIKWNQRNPNKEQLELHVLDEKDKGAWTVDIAKLDDFDRWANSCEINAMPILEFISKYESKT